MKNYYLLLITFNLVFSLYSCSVKQDEYSPGSPMEADVGPQSGDDPDVEVKDTDLDALPDELEVSLGRDPLTGRFPGFKVSNFRESKITIWNFEDRALSKGFIYNMRSDYFKDLSYTPVRDKISKHAYERVVGTSRQPQGISPYDLGVIKLSNFNIKTQLNLNEHIKNRFNELSPEMVKFESRFFLSAYNMKGIKKISNIKVELGLVSEDGGFESFGYTENIPNLLSTSRQRVAFNSTGESEEVLSSSEILVLIDRVDLNFARRISEDGLDLALKVVDFTAETVSGDRYQYSKKINQASSNLRMFAISTQSGSEIFFNSRSETIQKTLEREIGEVRSDGEGSIIEIKNHPSTTSFPILFEDGGSNHMEGMSWFLFSESGSISDVPNIGSSVMVGYLRNDEIAKSVERLIQAFQEERKEEVGTVFQFNNLSLGETIEIDIEGSLTRPIINNIVQTTASAYVWTCGGYGNPGQIADLMNPPMSQNLNIRWRQIEYKEDPLPDPLDLKIKTIKYPSGIALSREDFWQGTSPMKLNEGNWRLYIQVTKSFLGKFGDGFKLEFPEKSIGEFYYGLMSHHGNGCGKVEFHNPEIKKYKSEGFITRDLKISVNRLFR